MALYFLEDKKNILDDRRIEDKIFHVQDLSVTYTLKTDDITKGEKPDCTPYVSRTDVLTKKENFFVGIDTKSELRIESYQDGLKFFLKSDNTELSEFGVNLPFNFMGKVDGGGWENQFLFNSPYLSEDRNIFYVYLTKPNGAHLLLAAKGAVGWKMDYSPYVGGHYFVNLKIFANFDKAFDIPKRKNVLEFVIFPVLSFEEALEKLSSYYGVPFLKMDKNGGEIGSSVSLQAFGTIDEIHVGEKRLPFQKNITLDRCGEIKVTPFYRGKKGAEITLYAYDSLEKLYKKSMDSVDLEIIKKHTDGNLCEHQSWCLPMLRFLIYYKDRLTENEIKEYENKILLLLSVVTEKNPEKAVYRRTIFFRDYEGFPAYNIFKSRRIQEQFFGIGILLDAYKYFKNEEYMRYAVGACKSLIENYQNIDGGLKRFVNGIEEDYTTVCAPMIPLVDLANFLKEERNQDADYYFQAAAKMAEYLYRRGLNFPTEGGETSIFAEAEMEDGSISCTALNLLYYCAKVRREERYIRKAKEILDIHEAWVIKTPRCQMHGSSLRWWETRWEGDADGPAICAGHAWTIWRAEADFWYAWLMDDKEYYKKSFNGFMTNLSKIDKDGNSYAIYNVDDVNGGGFKKRSDEINFKLASKYASVRDCGLSRYAWGRLTETFLRNNKV